MIEQDYFGQFVGDEAPFYPDALYLSRPGEGFRDQMVRLTYDANNAMLSALVNCLEGKHIWKATTTGVMTCRNCGKARD